MSVHDRSLPDFPWNTLAGAKQRAHQHPDGIVDLSVGTPVDPTPELGQRALIEAANAPGYPTVWGTPELRAAIRGYLTKRWGGVAGVDAGVEAGVAGGWASAPASATAWAKRLVP